MRKTGLVTPDEVKQVIEGSGYARASWEKFKRASERHAIPGLMDWLPHALAEYVNVCKEGNACQRIKAKAKSERYAKAGLRQARKLPDALREIAEKVFQALLHYTPVLDTFGSSESWEQMRTLARMQELADWLKGRLQGPKRRSARPTSKALIDLLKPLAFHLDSPRYEHVYNLLVPACRLRGFGPPDSEAIAKLWRRYLKPGV